MAKDKQKETTDVATVPQETKAVATSGYAEDSGAGFESMTADHFLMPFIGILQKMSPLMDTLAGAKAGNILNTATQDQFDGTKGIAFIPVHTEHKFVEWIPRDNGGGYVGQFPPEAPEVAKAKAEAGTEFGKLVLGENDLVETFYCYGLRLDEDGSTYPEVIPFSSTQIKAFKTWMTKARGIKLRDDEGRQFPAPLFAHKYRLNTQLTQNTKGSWHVWTVAFDGPTAESARLPADSSLYKEVKELRKMVVEGRAKADFSKAEGLNADPDVVKPDDKF